MIGILMVAAFQAAAPPGLPTEEEIVVTGRRMSQLRYGAKVNPRTGKARCWVATSSGDPRIDFQVCKIVEACAVIKPRKRERIEECVRIRKQDFLETYVRPGKPS